MLIRQIEQFITDSGPSKASGESLRDTSEELERLALRAFTFQYERIEPLRRLCDRRGCTPASVAHWSEIPAVPTSAFKSFVLCAATARECFRSSGTTQGSETRSVHYHPYPDLYRATIDATFRDACLPGAAPLAILSLIPSRTQLPDSSLSFMADHILENHAREPRCLAITEHGVDLDRALDWLEGRAAASAPGLILTTAFALAELIEALEVRDIRAQLPRGSVIFETGGFKGRRRELERTELLAGVESRLGVPPGFVVREYGMTELTGQAYTRVLQGGDPDCFYLPPWMRFRVLDPARMNEVEPGELGLLALFDLSNVGSALSVLTEDLARQIVEPSRPGRSARNGRAESGFVLEGRAAGAELRGCSLTVEELGLAPGEAPA